MIVEINFNSRNDTPVAVWWLESCSSSTDFLFQPLKQEIDEIVTYAIHHGEE